MELSRALFYIFVFDSVIKFVSGLEKAVAESDLYAVSFPIIVGEN